MNLLIQDINKKTFNTYTLKAIYIDIINILNTVYPNIINICILQ